MSGCHVPYVVGNVAFASNVGGYCNCSCHAPTWMGTNTPICWCSCNQKQPMDKVSVIRFENERLKERIEELEKELRTKE